MINPQSLTLMQAYDPYLTSEELLFIQAGEDAPLRARPSADDPSWIDAFSFDCENIHVHVIIRGYSSVSDAQEWLIAFLDSKRKMFRIGGFTQEMTEEQYASEARGWFYSSDDCEDGQ
jgi:hypothetical protein